MLRALLARRARGGDGAVTDGLCPFAEQIVGRNQLIGWQAGGHTRVGFCDHTAGGWFSTMQRVGFWNDPNGNGVTDDAVSVHFAIARDGRVLQVLNIFDTAFAQGRLGPSVAWPPYADMQREGPNLYLISTEHEDYESVNGVSRAVPGSEWTGPQYESDLRVKRWCRDEVMRVQGADVLRFGINSLAGHHMFDAVNRAGCPGRFWRDEYRDRLFADLTGGGDLSEEDKAKIERERLRRLVHRTLDRDDYGFVVDGQDPNTQEWIVNIQSGVGTDEPLRVRLR